MAEHFLSSLNERIIDHIISTSIVGFETPCAVHRLSITVQHPTKQARLLKLTLWTILKKTGIHHLAHPRASLGALVKRGWRFMAEQARF